ncbi:hypothetical protein HK097_002287 [Rhizophlyctis rosea]|uniref:Hemerythrin-like domain-containing protein n=1 Tax=Rhizophlyctis rosea TaxID=64517 RepID=A0AAD5S5K3_9FUNG|nr:hypothetical protein HK097_002287 [Rhizophlyctis rosea]
MPADVFQTHVDGLHMIHSVLRNGLQSAINNCQTVTPTTLPSYLHYLRIYHQLLHSHHDHEEDFEFPVFKPKMPTIDAFEEEHVKLMSLLDELKDLSKEENATEEKFDREKTEKCLKELQGLMVPHLAAEEKEVTASNLKSLGFTEKEVAEVDKKIGGALAKLDGSIFVPMMYYNMDDDMKSRQWLTHFPWILRSVIFPWFWASKHKLIWQFTAYPPK